MQSCKKTGQVSILQPHVIGTLLQMVLLEKRCIFQTRQIWFSFNAFFACFRSCAGEVAKRQTQRSKQNDVCNSDCLLSVFIPLGKFEGKGVILESLSFFLFLFLLNPVTPYYSTCGHLTAWRGACLHFALIPQMYFFIHVGMGLC